MDGARALEEQLGAPPPAGLVAVLDSAQLSRLAETVRAARRQQSRELARAGEEALNHVPALLRAPVRRIVGL